MGKHAAPEGSAVHPLVAGALARRAATGADEPDEPTPAERTGPVGWPAPPVPGGGGLGWPGRDSADVAPEDMPAAGAEAPAAAPRGWRRLFRVRPAA